MKKKGWRFSVSGEPEVSFMDITPAMAAEALLANDSNRTLSMPLVRKYVHAMKSGHWHITHQGCGFYTDGNIADCQHRFKAIVDSNMTVRMQVTVGISRDAAIAIDAHRPRSDSDRLAISGYSPDYLKARVAIIRMLHSMAIPGKESKQLDLDDIRDVLVAIEKEIDLIISITKSKIARTSHSVVRAALLAGLLHNAVGVATLTRFCSILETGTDADSEEIAAIRLRDYLMTTKWGGQQTRRDMFLRTQRALKAFIDRQSIGKLYAPDIPLWDCAFLFDDIVSTARDAA